MAREQYSTEQIIILLQEAEVLESKGMTAAEAAKEIWVSEQLLIRWKTRVR